MRRSFFPICAIRSAASVLRLASCSIAQPGAMEGASGKPTRLASFVHGHVMRLGRGPAGERSRGREQLSLMDENRGRAPLPRPRPKREEGSRPQLRPRLAATPDGNSGRPRPEQAFVCWLAGCVLDPWTCMHACACLLLPDILALFSGLGRMRIHCMMLLSSQKKSN